MTSVTLFPPGSAWRREKPENVLFFATGQLSPIHRDSTGKRIEVKEISLSSSRVTLTLSDGTKATFSNIPYFAHEA